MKHSIAFLFLACTIFFCCAENIKLEVSENWKAVTEMLPVSGEKCHQLSCAIQGGSGEADIMICQYTEKKERIGGHNVNASAGTQTSLAAPSVRGAKSLLVQDASSWNFPKKGKLLAFNVKEDLSDLPNNELDYYISSVKKENNAYRIDFTAPLKHSFPAGTAVRLHYDGGNTIFRATLPQASPLIRSFKPAAKSGNVADALWHGTAYVQIMARNRTKKPILVNCEFKQVDAAQAKQIAQKVSSQPTPMSPYGSQKVLVSTADELVFLNDYLRNGNEVMAWSGATKRKLSIPAAQIGQFEIDLKSEVPVFTRMMFILEKGGKSVDVHTSYQTVLPNGEYRRYIFTPQDRAKWDNEATITGWTLRMQYYDETGKIMGAKHPVFTKKRNLIPLAEELQPGQEMEMHGLRPIGEYKLSWTETNACPGVTLRFYNHRMIEIPDTAITLPSGKNEIRFTAPEQMIFATAAINGKAQGYPLLECEYYKMRYEPEIFWRGKWIWSRHISQGPNYSYVWFERTFDLDEAPDYAVLGLMADDKSEIFLNGEAIGQTYRYSIPGRFLLTNKLKKGKNTLSVCVYNLDMAAGLCADLYMHSPAGKDEYLLTDENWLCYENGKEKNRPSAIDKPVVVLGSPATTPPWINQVGFVYVGPRGRFNLKKTSNGEFTAVLDRTVITRYRAMKFERKTEDGKSQYFELPITLERNEDGTVTVKYPKLLPTSQRSRVYLADNFWEIIGNKPLAEIPAQAIKRTDFQKAEILNCKERPRLKLGKEIHDFTLYSTDDAYERMAPSIAAGVHGYIIKPPLEKIWLAHGKFNFAPLDQQVEHLLTVDPNAFFMLDIRFYMPEWWLAENPDDTSCYFEKTRRNTYDDMQALGSKHWLKQAEEPMAAILEHTKAMGYADRIFCFNVGEGRGNEWFWGGATGGTDFYRKPAQAGYSPADYRTFRAMLRQWYKTDEALAKAWNMPGVTIDSAPMPDHNIRRKGSVGSLFDETKDAQIMDWCRFRNNASAEAIIHLASKVKELTGNKLLVSCYYGYMNELSESGRRSQLITGHNGFSRCINSGVVDIFRAPSRYGYRRPGFPGGIMQTFSSMTLHGRQVYIELDQRTGYGPSEGDDYDVYCGRGTTALESVGQLNREFAIMCSTGTIEYWKDHTRGSLYEPALWSPIKEQLDFYASLGNSRNLTPAEVAVVGDTESIYYSVDGDNCIFGPAGRGIYKKINYLGAPFHSIVLADLLDKNVVPSHKLYIMLPMLVLTSEQRQALLERFAAEQATVVWLYSAGSSYPRQPLKAGNCCDFLGISCEMDTNPHQESLLWNGGKWFSNFKNAPWFFPKKGYDSVLCCNEQQQPVLVSRTIQGATHIFSTLPDLPTGLLADIYRRACVFRYVNVEDDLLWIGNDIIALYARKDGEKCIFLKNGGSLKAVLGPLNGIFRSGEPWKARAGMTYIFSIE